MNGPSGRTIIQASTLSMRSTSTGSPVVFASTPPVLSRLRHTTGGFRVEAARAFRASACSRMTLVCSLASASCSAASRLASSASARARLDRFFITQETTANTSERTAAAADTHSAPMRPSNSEEAPAAAAARAQGTRKEDSVTIIPFSSPEFGQLRTIEQGGRVLFCGRDAATALGYKDSINAIKQHCRGVALHHPITDRFGRTQQVRFITEGDLYRLIAGSRLPAAVRFESWVFDEVLPSIRRRGAYLTPEAAERALTDPDFIIRLAQDLKAERARRAELEAQAEADRPKVLFADSVAASCSTILVGELAKILRGNGIAIGQNRLFEVLRRRGYLIAREGSDRNAPTQRAMELGLFQVKETAVCHSDGHTTVSRTPKVTGRGQQYFIERFLDGRLTPDLADDEGAAA